MKALGLLSGGLDSTLATKLVLEQHINVIVVKFTSPFCNCDSKGRCHAADVAERFNIPLITVAKGDDYLQVIRNPKHGYGSEMNPCIDCRIFMLKKAKRIAEDVGAAFIFTGEVLGERPMSQHRHALTLIEREAGLENKIVRPLSAQLLPETIPEKKGWIDRSKLLAIHGRSRTPQMALAATLAIGDYPCPAGGCLLTQKEFAAKVRDLFDHKKDVSMKDVLLLRIGRHLRFEHNKIIIGRNEIENTRLLTLKAHDDYVFEVSTYGSPLTILQGPKEKEAIAMAAKATARYSDAKEKEIPVTYYNCNTEKKKEQIVVSPLDEESLARLRI